MASVTTLSLLELQTSMFMNDFLIQPFFCQSTSNDYFKLYTDLEVLLMLS